MLHLNDHEELRRDPLLAFLARNREIREPPAGKSTLSRVRRRAVNWALASCEDYFPSPTKTKAAQK